MASTTRLDEDQERRDECVPHKMNKKAKLREAAELTMSNVPNRILNMYLVPRKLLVFDINKVLLHRQAKSSSFKVRPHAYAFIAGMSQRYTLAVWTSMTKKSAKPILAELFPQQHIPLLFNWYQNRCHSIPNELVPDGKPLFLKELSRVWGEFSQFNESNTILLDDTSEKCARNPPHTSIQPCPYEPHGPRPPPQFDPYIAPAFSIRSGSDHSASSVRVDAPAKEADANEIDLDDLEGDKSGELTAAESNAQDVSPVSEDNSVPVSVLAEASSAAVEGGKVESVVCESANEPAGDTAGPDNADNCSGATGPTDSFPVSADTPAAAISPSDVCVANRIAPVEALQTAPPTVQAPPVPLFRPPPPPFFRPPPMHGPPPLPPAAFNPYMVEEDCELIPGGPLWNYLDILARHNGPVQEIYEQLGPYRFY